MSRDHNVIRNLLMRWTYFKIELVAKRMLTFMKKNISQLCPMFTVSSWRNLPKASVSTPRIGHWLVGMLRDPDFSVKIPTEGWWQISTSFLPLLDKRLQDQGLKWLMLFKGVGFLIHWIIHHVVVRHTSGRLFMSSRNFMNPFVWWTVLNQAGR
jgi:hypothetical protein